MLTVSLPSIKVSLMHYLLSVSQILHRVSKNWELSIKLWIMCSYAFFFVVI